MRTCRACNYGPLGNNNTSGYCLTCGRRMRCSVCRQMVPSRVGRRCPDCASRPGPRVDARIGRRGGKYKTPAWVEERIRQYSEVVEAGGRLFEEGDQP